MIVSALKKAEDGDAYVLRAYETNRQETKAVIQLSVMGRVIEAIFNPCEIKTFYTPADKGQPVRQVNLLEWEEA